MIFEDRQLVMVVDDTATNLAVISEALNDAGFETAVATSGERALKQIERRAPDLILLDVMMPGIDGFETCRRLKADPRHCDIPIIFMTALADLDSKIMGFDLGAVDYITKPFQEREVLARVGTHIKLQCTSQRLEASEARLANILNSLDEIVWSAALNPFRLLQVSPAVKKVCGYSPEALINDPDLWLNSIDPSDLEKIQAHFTQPQEHERLRLEYQMTTAQGKMRWLKSKMQIRRCSTTQQYIIDGITHDISDRKKAEAQLQYTACHDGLTGLLNRTSFIQAVDEIVAEQQPLSAQPEIPHRSESHSGYHSIGPQEHFAVLFIDLDRFKTVNDSLGHQQGDQLLTKVGDILKLSVRPSDVVARLGGDEFTILLRHLCDETEAQLITQRLQSNLEVSLELDNGVKVAMSASIGIVMGNAKYCSAHELLRDADIAMYQAKKLGKACHQLFSEDMYEEALKKINLEQDLRAALERSAGGHRKDSELLLHYQPIHQLSNQELTGFEALVRWNHPQQGMISPGEFIPLAEETGLIVPLGWQILRTALTQLRDWQTDRPTSVPLTMSINLSIRQFQETNFLAKLDELLTEIGIPPSMVKLEITESLLMHSGEKGCEILHALRSRGFSLSLDDFGTGYSSLSYLHRFPINTLKIDRSFIQNLEPGVNSVEIVRTIMALARSLRMDVIAEGVETEAQATQLQALDCEMVQGYLFSRPLDANAATDYLANLCSPSASQQPHWESDNTAETNKPWRDEPRATATSVAN